MLTIAGPAPTCSKVQYIAVCTRLHPCDHRSDDPWPSFFPINATEISATHLLAHRSYVSDLGETLLWKKLRAGGLLRGSVVLVFSKEEKWIHVLLLI